ncbi:hypothetical protein [Thioflexithrix psekupsensis]|uniref:NlpE C-terminal OB domain-containing protein n=1 Tax=Thioflexithrix psekupsensis TaxID=1570016 RepID=A0A251X8Q4_9GAMM|nr:hypothetical protein [Thioflexithrix psekupsensis]OUD13912.1 hypothetical protein TPSD3_06095 [Thioflexithrix psekupsensis]
MPKLPYWMLSSVLFIAVNTTAMTVETPPVESFEGVLRMNPWQKGSDSYCAGGSEYFVLQQADGQEIVLATPEDVSTWQEFVDQKVSIQGVFETKILPTASESSDEPMLEQRPVVPMGAVLTCELLVVDSLTLTP